MPPILKHILIVALFSAIQVRTGYAQQGRKILNADTVSSPIVIDGNLNEPAWQNRDKATSFIQYAPYPGAPSSQRTEVTILYNNDAVYIGAKLYDSKPDSILRQLSSRDDLSNNDDVFGVFLDTYDDRQNGFSFTVTAAGVQADASVKFDNIDYSWNAPWYSKVSLNEKGWCVEMKIPYSALRFPKKPIQEWGINFMRVIRRCRESSYWNPVLPNVPNFAGQSGVLHGVHDIISPVRLALFPYVSAYAENYAGVNAHTFNGGMDIKYGFNESFTFDMTLIPDFGQTIFDNRVLNLSPIEVRYDERRYFFTEGLDLFNKNDLFYSRRVGGAPVDYNTISNLILPNEVVDQNPAATKIYNAVKVSGRTKHKLGIGFFNAVSGAAYATVRDTINNISRQVQTAPLTNYNVIVLDQALKNNSYVSFINTNVTRQENSYNADVCALLFKFMDKTSKYGVDGSSDMSQLYSPGTRPDAGFRYYLDGGKFSGNYTWQLSTKTISDRFNPNDLGYLDRNNLTYYELDEFYNIYKPVGHIVNANNHIGIDYYRVFNPDVFMQADLYGSHNVTFKNYLTTGIFYTLEPLTIYDYYEPRTFGRFYLYPKNYQVGAFYSSDYRKKFALDLQLTNRWFSAPGRNTMTWLVSPRYRFSDKFSMVYSLSGSYAANDVGFVDNVNGDIYFGTRNVNTITNTLDAAYIFTPTMSLKLDARHYWSEAIYSQYSLLGNDGRLNATSYNTDHDINFNTFNVYISFVWQYLPGSELSVVYQNSIYSFGQQGGLNYFTDLNTTIQAPQSNSLSVKAIYYLDYLAIRKVLRKNN